MSGHDETEAGRAEDRLAKRASALFDESVRGLDAETLSKLNRSRRRALAEVRSTGAGVPWSRWMPVAVAAAAAAGVVVWWSGAGELPSAAPLDAEILLAEEELEMLEDLEFYRWMAMVEAEKGRRAEDDVG